jgi:phosphate ABC transporter phosphate-binding protein
LSFPRLFQEFDVRRVLIGLLCLACLVPGCSPQPDRSLNGTGSTLIAPLMEKWSKEYATAKGVKVVYESIGSGVGFDRWKGGLFDYCCTDAPLSREQLDKANRGEVLHIPLTIGAVVPVYHLELPEGQTVVFNGPVLSLIYRGEITKWNADQLKALNPDVALPDEDIIVVHREDASGTTYIWTDYLNKVDPKSWKATTTMTWPGKGKGAYGNAGVSSLIKSKLYSIGYVSFQEAMEKKLSMGKMTKPGAGGDTKRNPVEANAKAVTAAVDSLTSIPEDLRISIIDAPGDDAWPICGTTWAIVSVNQPAGRGQILKDFLKWATHDGQNAAEELGYVRLPSKLVERVDKQIDKISVAK